MYSLAERVPVPVAMLHLPFCVTLHYFDGVEDGVVDATLVEQQVSVGEVVVTANAQGEVCQIAKQGGAPAEALVLLKGVDLSVRKVKELEKVVKAALERDERERDVGGLILEMRAENERIVET